MVTLFILQQVQGVVIQNLNECSGIPVGVIAIILVNTKVETSRIAVNISERPYQHGIWKV
jgi:hypothetical protein